ncbi:tripartite tricarboxylate transporter substrate binding protein [Aquabacter sp. L1I39]|uniref:tripartite tricarboxylate transporter substrate binding protein n=1 Tax=Aquabacter sp. L1I39 TaxID=2820278 RepID=UPI001AD95D0F|nr:tripartite tricarboxylate transporter substrate binding protein [Aquabacter sp. L1I39]QTL04793.1 tripartite tricarboxylate transporter substrate binding protein [Aquabacter sp. L1I39]
MRISRRELSLFLGSAIGGAAAGLHVLPSFAAEDYPARPVAIVVSFAPGGMTDTVARLLGTDLAKALGQPFVVENRAGAAGQVGTEYVARKPPDGYTLLVSATGHVIGPAVQKVNYDPVSDFAVLAILARAPNLLLVHKSVPVSTVPEFLAWMKAEGEVPYASAGAGGSTHLAGELLRTMSGGGLVHVPYKGAAPAINDLAAGHVKMAFQDSMSVAAFIASGDVKPIAVTTLDRSPLFPDLPTLNESGFPGFDLYTWLGFYAPKGTPSDIVQLLNREANRITHQPSTLEWLHKMNCEPAPAFDPQEAAAFVADEVKKWAGVVKTSGVKVQ